MTTSQADETPVADKPQTDHTWQKVRKLLPYVVFVVVAFILARYFNVASLRGFLAENKVLGFMICLFAYVVVGAALIPPDPIALLVLAWMGPVVAIIFDTLGDTILSLIDYYMGTKIGDLSEFEKKKANLPFHLGEIPVDTPAFQILARMTPAVGAKLVCTADGVYHVPMKTFLWTSIVANLIGAIFVVFGASGLFQLFRKIPGGAVALRIVPNHAFA